MKTSLNLYQYTKKLLFIPLGGCGEIGMNLSLYHFNQSWIIVDMGLGFPDPNITPGASIVLPNIDFILKNIINNIDALIITHAHEDHIGAIPHLWQKIKCPIYTTKFTSLIIQEKAREYSFFNDLKIFLVKPGEQTQIKHFTIELIEINHSIPEAHSLLIKTEAGNVFHTGDWRLERITTKSEQVNMDNFARLNHEKILAMVCDSTNVLNKYPDYSEDDLAKNLTSIIENHTMGLIIITTFASNVTRIRNIMIAAQKVNRKIFLLGKSLDRIFRIAKKSGHLSGIEIEDSTNLGQYDREKILVLCTGCQGEDLAALNRIANKRQMNISVQVNDLIVFSSKIIPGNERKIYRMQNKFSELGAKVLNEYNAFTHVSGHPSKLELEKLYNYLKPRISIPVHGDYFHLNQHCQLAKDIKVPHVISIKNGYVAVLDENNPKIIGVIEHGKYIIDGSQILNEDSLIFKERLRLHNHGIIILTVLVSKNLSSKIYLNFSGILDNMSDKKLIQVMKEKTDLILKKDICKDNAIIKKKLSGMLQKLFITRLNKKPIIQVNIGAS